MDTPFLTPDNVLDYQEENIYSYRGRKHLDLHTAVNTYIESLHPNKHIDGGGRYAVWLNKLGFNHQTDVGWWNQTAVDLDNIHLFIEWELWDNGDNPEQNNEKMLRIKSRIERLQNLPKGVRLDLIDHHAKVESYLE